MFTANSPRPIARRIYAAPLISLCLVFVSARISYAQDASSQCDCTRSAGSCSVGGQIIEQHLAPTDPIDCGHSCDPYQLTWKLRITVGPPVICAAVKVSVVVRTPGTAQALKSQRLQGIDSVYIREVHNGELLVEDRQTASSTNSGVKYDGAGPNSCHICPLNSDNDNAAAAAAAAAAKYNATQGVPSPLSAPPAISSGNSTDCPNLNFLLSSIQAQYSHAAVGICEIAKRNQKMNEQLAEAYASCSAAWAIQQAQAYRSAAAAGAISARQACN
jgi:hypothetical protein